MNLPNKLTVLRVILVPVFMLFLCVPLGLSDTLVRVIAAVLFALTSLTDMLDGKIARKYNMVTDFGKLMDPLADKVMVICVMLTQALQGCVPWAVLGVVLVAAYRDGTGFDVLRRYFAYILQFAPSFDLRALIFPIFT